MHLRVASCQYRPERNKGRFISKIRAANESYPRKMNVVTVITHFCKFIPA